MTYPKPLIDNTINFIVSILKYKETKKWGEELFELQGSQRHHAVKELQAILSPFANGNSKVIVISAKQNRESLQITRQPASLFEYFDSEKYVFPNNFKIIITHNRSYYRSNGVEVEIYNHSKFKSKQRMQKIHELKETLDYEQQNIDVLATSMKQLSLQDCVAAPSRTNLSLEQQYAPPAKPLLWEFINHKLNESHPEAKASMRKNKFHM